MAMTTSSTSENPENIDNSINLALCRGLHEQKKNGIFCDVVLKIRDYRLATHSCVLSVFSPFFLSMLNKTGRPSSADGPEEIDVDIRLGQAKDCDDGCVLFEALEAVIDFLYTGTLTLSDSNINEVFHVAETLKLELVSARCHLFLRNADIGKHSLEHTSCTKRKAESFESASYEKYSIAESDRQLRKTKRCLNSNSTQNYFSSEKNDSDIEMVAEVDIADVARDSEEDSDGEGGAALTDGRYTCCKCSFTTDNKLEARAHRRIHPGKLYNCKACGFLAVQAYKLLAHLIETKHGGTVCYLCNFEAETEEKLQEHLERHDDEKPFFCDTCDQRFKTRTALNLHLPKHSSEKPFVCNICLRGFKWKYALNSHMVVHSDVKQHLCDECGYRTAHKSSFKAHQLLHTGETYKCSYAGCEFQAVRKQNLKQHMLTHTKEKPYQCEICGQAFSLSKNMRRHARMHNIDNEIRCTLCTFITTRADKFKDHMKKHHGDSSGNDQAKMQNKSGNVNLQVVSISLHNIDKDQQDSYLMSSEAIEHNGEIIMIND